MNSYSVPPLPLPLLITGISGVAGYNALPYFYARYGSQVVGIRQADNWRLVGPGVVVCNAEDRATLEKLFDRFQFRSVLDTAGNCALKSCELDPAMAWRINVDGVKNLLAVMRGGNTRYVHLSIDLVFSGVGSGGYLETAIPDPVTAYGQSMVAAEELILADYPTAAILRISLPMGISFNGHAGAIDWIQSRFKKHKPATLYFDEVRTPTFTDCLNELCEVVLARPNIQGLYHAGGTRALSLYQIAQIVNRVGGYDPHLLHGIPRIEAGPMPPRAGNVSMNSSKLAAALGYQPFDPWPLEERWIPTDREWHYRREPAEGGCGRLLAELLYRNPRRNLHIPPKAHYQPHAVMAQPTG
ncbi:MAG: sugar nucleotide-binding protein [Pirellulales bacterium]|nr:sugar nucleotide-binding protein [Pirellulales bacterium]